MYGIVSGIQQLLVDVLGSTLSTLLNLKKFHPCATGWSLKFQGLSYNLLLLHGGPSQDLSLLLNSY